MFADTITQKQKNGKLSGIFLENVKTFFLRQFSLELFFFFLLLFLGNYQRKISFV